VVYTAGVKHANNVAKAFQDAGINARAVSGETPKRELAETLAAFERGEVDVLCNAMLLAEGWNSPRATICMHLAPTASRRVYQQRVGRVTRRNPGKESGLVIDFVHPATTHDETIVTLHSLLDRDVYRGGAIVVGPVRRGRGRRVRVERRVLPVTPDPDRRAPVFERELWRIAVEHLDYGEQHVWAALAGARVAPHRWRRDQANAWIWQLAEYTREIHEEYAVQRWPETKRLLGLLVNSSGAAHARNARRLVHAARKQDRRLAAALLAAALAHTPEAQQALDGARTRMSRKPSALARELLRNFPKGRRRGRQRRRKGADAGGEPKTAAAKARATEASPSEEVLDEALV